MSLQPAALGRFWLGPQIARGTPATTYYGMKANLVGVAPGQMTRSVGQLVGGGLLPSGSIKTAAWSGGGVVMPPSLDDYIGWLLYAYAGSVSSVDNGDDTHTHYFPAGADETNPNKYLTARRKVPATAAIYEQMEDQRVYRLLWGLTPGEMATLRAEMIGRTASKPDGSGWAFTPKDETSVPVVCKGAFELPDDSAIETATAITLDLSNVTPDMRRVLVAASFYPYDFPVLGRAITISFRFLWENATLYSSLFYDGAAWTPVVYSSSFEAEIQSPGVITGILPYKLSLYAANVDWVCTPVELAGGDMIEMQMVGTVADAATGFDWYLALTNGTASYTWPTE